HDDPAVIVDVRVELALDEVRIGQRDLLEPLRQVEQRIVDAELLEQRVARGLDDLCARIEVLVDAMPEAHEPHARVPLLDPLDELLELLAALEELRAQPDDGHVRAAMERPPE